MNTIRRAMRNLTRAPGRSVLVISLIAVTLGAALVALAIRAGAGAAAEEIASRVGNRVEIRSSLAGYRQRVMEEMERIQQEGGDLSEAATAFGREPLDEKLVDRLADLPWVVEYDKSMQVQAAAPELEPLPEQTAEGSFRIGGREFMFGRSGWMDTGASTMPLTVQGHLESKMSSDLLSGARELAEGRHFTAEDTSSGAYLAQIDQALADINGLAVGDSFTLETTTAGDEDPETRSVTVEVVGIFTSTRAEGGMYFRDPGNTMVVTLAAARAVAPDRPVDTAAYFLTRAEDYDAFRLEASWLGLDLELFDLVSDRQDYTAVAGPLEEIKGSATMALYVSLLAGAASIVLLMSIIARERKREMGILRALGATRLQVTGGFFAEAVAMCFVALLVGSFAAGFAAGPVAEAISARAQAEAAGLTQGGASLWGPMGDRAEMAVREGMFARLRGGGLGALPAIAVEAEMNWTQMASGIGITLFLAALGALMPTLLCLRLRPSDILRAE